MTVVLDSWTVLRLLEDTEPSASRVQAELDGDSKPVMIWINLGEVFSVVRRMHGHEAGESGMRDLRARVGLDLPDATRVFEAATIKADHAMACADAFDLKSSGHPFFAGTTRAVHDRDSCPSRLRCGRHSCAGEGR